MNYGSCAGLLVVAVGSGRRLSKLSCNSRGNRAEKKDEKNKFTPLDRPEKTEEHLGKIGHLCLEKSKKWGYTIQYTRFLGFFCHKSASDGPLVSANACLNGPGSSYKYLASLDVKY